MKSKQQLPRGAYRVDALNNFSSELGIISTSKQLKSESNMVTFDRMNFFRKIFSPKMFLEGCFLKSVSLTVLFTSTFSTEKK